MATTKLILDPEIEAEYLEAKKKSERAERIAWRTEIAYQMAQCVHRMPIDISIYLENLEEKGNE